MSDMLSIKFDERSLKEMARKVRAFLKEYPKVVQQGLRMIGERVMTDSKEHYVPVKDGILKGSGHVISEKFPPKALVAKVTLAYGGPAGEYAIEQHQNLYYKHPGGGEAKYLEKPFNKAIPTILPEIAARCPVDKAKL